MKYSVVPKSMLKFAVAALVMTVGFTACDDKDDDIDPIDREAQVGVLNLLTDVESIDAYLDEDKINSDAVEVGEFSDYLTIAAGEGNLSVSAADVPGALATATHDFKAEESFSAFVLGNATDAELLIVSDNLDAPAGGKAKIRFANLAADSDALELWAEDGAEALLDGVEFKSINGFVEVDPLTGVSLQVRADGSDEVLAELAAANVVAGKIYTAYVSLEDVEGVDTLVLHLIANK